MQRKNRIYGLVGSILLAAGLLLLFFAKTHPVFAQWYSTHIYPLWVNSLGRLTGIFPFSVVELLLYVTIAAVAVTGGVLAAGVCRKKKGKTEVCGWLSRILLLAGALLFLYAVNCGINYHRASFAETAGLQVREYSEEELKEVCLWLTEEVNARSDQVTRDAEGVMQLSEGERKEAVRAMQKLGDIYPEMAGYYPQPKGLIFPAILSVQNLTGVYSPFTIEANYNSAITDYNIPFTMCHELSHLRGFMQEQEANFIAYLACMHSESMEFQYSGSLLGWIYCMNVLYKTDYEVWEEVRANLSPEAEADLQANREFWNRYDGVVAEVSNKVNDTYLKANGQADGVKSYDRMVDLLVVYYEDEIAD